MGVRLVVLALAGAFSTGRCVMLSSDNASDEIRSLTDLDIQDLDGDLLEGSSGVEEEKIKLVIEKTYCARTEAVNALLSHDMNLENAVTFINNNKEAQSDCSSSVPMVKPLPSGRVWGEQSEIGTVSFREASSQIGGDADPDGRNLGETVVVTARQGFPRREEIDNVLDRKQGNVTLGISLRNDDSMTLKCVYPRSWALQHTNLKDFESKKYSLTKINSHTVSNQAEFFQVMNSLSAGDPVSFTLVKQLFTQGEGVNEFVSACRSGDIAIVQRILEADKEFDVNKRLEGNDDDLKMRYGKHIVEGSTPLHVACCHGSLSVVQELVNRCDVEVKDSNWATPLYRACQNCQSSVVRVLLTHPDVNVNARASQMGRQMGTPLRIACREGDVDIVQQLIERPEIEVNGRDIQTPLMEAAYHGFPMVVKCLLTHPKIDTTKTTSNKTAFMLASEEFVPRRANDPRDPDRINKGRKEVVQILTEYEHKKKSNQM